jgi:uncharacterized protein
MRSEELILLTIYYSDKKMIAGRTLLQKTLYFLNEKLKQDIEFAPHYYGPYSSQIADEISSLSAAGFIRENIETFTSFSFGTTYEPRKYIYQLTESGMQFSKIIEGKDREFAMRINQILNDMKAAGAIDDYKSLSIAAKMYHILKKKQRGKPSEILSEATALDWHIDTEEAETAIEFLKNMRLIEVEKK